ncbi:MAG: hypothetical protein O8C67_12760, partial [Candidatus Methanoperedens sp.]|nr:hypothetical protein [Candidatus Methanoperedens sp.]
KLPENIARLLLNYDNFGKLPENIQALVEYIEKVDGEITLTNKGKLACDRRILSAEDYNKKATEKMLKLLGLDMGEVTGDLLGALQARNEKLEKIMVTSFNDVHALCQEENCSMRTAAYQLAVKRILYAERLRGNL